MQAFPNTAMDKPEPASRSTPSGLFVTVDELRYFFRPEHAPEDRPHLFNYHLTIHNHSETTVTILARKWVLQYNNGEVDVFEGDKVVGKTPVLAPRESFSYDSFHMVGLNAKVNGAFHGVDAQGKTISVSIPVFDLNIPGEKECS